MVLPTQINGNDQQSHKDFYRQKRRKLEINLSVDITIDPKAKPVLTISTDANLINYIKVIVRNDNLDLTELEWMGSKGI
jgi:hypothetical protein